MAYSITESDYYQKQQPAKSEELLNYIEVPAAPLKEDDFNDSVYESNEPIVFTSSQTQTIEVKFSPIPIKGAAATAYITDSTGELFEDDDTGEYTNATMGISSTFYAWGAVLTITNPLASQQYCVIVCSGTPLKTIGKESLVAQDANSILENGILKYKLSDNHLLQSRVTAQAIADTLLATYVIPRKDIALDWRGNLALELTDEIIVPEYNKNGIYTEGTFFVYKQQTNYDGTVKQNTEGRKIA